MMSVSRIGGKNLLLTDRTNAWRESSALIMPRKNYSTTDTLPKLLFIPAPSLCYSVLSQFIGNLYAPSPTKASASEIGSATLTFAFAGT